MTRGGVCADGVDGVDEVGGCGLGRAARAFSSACWASAVWRSSSDTGGLLGVVMDVSSEETSVCDGAANAAVGASVRDRATASPASAVRKCFTAEGLFWVSEKLLCCFQP